MRLKADRHERLGAVDRLAIDNQGIGHRALIVLDPLGEEHADRPAREDERGYPGSAEAARPAPCRGSGMANSVSRLRYPAARSRLAAAEQLAGPANRASSAEAGTGRRPTSDRRDGALSIRRLGPLSMLVPGGAGRPAGRQAFTSLMATIGKNRMKIRKSVVNRPKPPRSCR